MKVFYFCKAVPSCDVMFTVTGFYMEDKIKGDSRLFWKHIVALRFLAL